ncbi:unnamed protein product [Laminaria digitata]
MASVSRVSSVAANVVAATVADSVASRWSSAENLDSVWTSFHRVIRSSLGSLCKLAAIDCLFKPFHFFVASIFHEFQTGDFLMICLRCAASYVLLHPLVFVSVHRLNFAEAVCHARATLRNHSRTLLFNDGMVVAVFTFLTLAFAVVPFLLYGYWALGFLFSSVPFPSVRGLILLCTVLVTLATLEVVLYDFKAVFVCLVQVPEEELAESDDRSPYNDLCKTWRDMQPAHPAAREFYETVQP